MSSATGVNLNYLPYTGPPAPQCIFGKLPPLASQSAATFQQPLTCSNGLITQQNRLQHQQTFYSSSDCAQCIAQTAAYLNECKQVSGVDTGKVWSPSQCSYFIRKPQCAAQINPSVVNVNKQVSVEPTLDLLQPTALHKQLCSHQSTSSNSSIPAPQQPIEMQDNSSVVDIAHCQGPACDQCSDLDTDSEQCDSLVFNYEPILGKILNEKKLALSRSAQVIKFLASQAARSPQSQHPTTIAASDLDNQ